MDLKRNYIRKFWQSSFICCFLAVLLLSSCKRDNNPQLSKQANDFIKKADMGLYGKNIYLFRFEDEDCQISINEFRKQIRLQSDDQLYYANIMFDIFPIEINDKVEAQLSYKTGKDENREYMNLVLLKINNKRYWLWDENKKMGIIVPNLITD